MRKLFVPILLAATLTACEVDPAKVVDAIKQGCGIAVVAASVADIIAKDPTMSITAITNLVCTGFKAAQATGKLGTAEGKSFEVTVNGQPVTIKLQ